MECVTWGGGAESHRTLTRFAPSYCARGVPTDKLPAVFHLVCHYPGPRSSLSASMLTCRLGKTLWDTDLRIPGEQQQHRDRLSRNGDLRAHSPLCSSLAQTDSSGQYQQSRAHGSTLHSHQWSHLKEMVVLAVCRHLPTDGKHSTGHKHKATSLLRGTLFFGR